ncbi:MAG TPA: 50S ribosomal protein L4 [Bacteroidales bacterium]|nr:50S ribosomal protein L4 [Bacteroidales bacterium]HPE56489.1 50S ribosomal protein L4 [Bacteroidales bacterium]HRX95728.1 50S ribosomal protein L4 [Bacteroidales bacterium]
MELEVYNISGQKTSKKVKLDEGVFGIEPNDHAIYLDVKQHMANKRQGTHKSKERGEVAGSTRKIKRQKGTGTARFGDIKNPVFRGGGRIFGPQPRDYGFKLNKKLKRLARLSALAYKVKENNMIVLEDFTFDAPKTKSFVEMINSFELQGKKVLLIMDKSDKNVYLSSRNLQKTKVISANAINTYDILNANNILIAESSIKEIEKLHSVN